MASPAAPCAPKRDYGELLLERKRNKRRKQRARNKQNAKRQQQHQPKQEDTLKRPRGDQACLPGGKSSPAPPVKPLAVSRKALGLARAYLVTENPRGGSLSDLLNPGHPAYSKALKQRYGRLSASQRKAFVELDRELMEQRKARTEAGVRAEYPFQVNEDDHCESSLEAYEVGEGGRVARSRGRA